MNRILDRLWIGDQSDLGDRVPLRALGFSAVVDLRDGVAEKDLGLPTLRLTSRDGDPWAGGEIVRTLDFIHDHTRSGKVLVACAAGMSRSAAITIGYLVRCGWDPAEAHARVKAARPIIDPISTMLEAVFQAVGALPRASPRLVDPAVLDDVPPEIVNEVVRDMKASETFQVLLAKRAGREPG